jgi:hypothetical protein
MAEKKFTQKADGKDYSVTLTDKEQTTASSVMKQHGVDFVLCLKKHNGAAMFFVNEQNCDNCMNRHGYEFAMQINKKDLPVEEVKTDKKG